MTKIVIKIIGFMTLIYGVLMSFGNGLLSLTWKTNYDSQLVNVTPLSYYIIGITAIIVGFGLLKLKRWSSYGYMILAGLHLGVFNELDTWLIGFIDLAIFFWLRQYLPKSSK